MLRKHTALVSVMALWASVSVVYAEQPEAELLSDDAIRKAYQDAAKSYAEEHPAQPADVTPSDEQEVDEGGLLAAPMLPEDEADVKIISKEAEVFHSAGNEADYLPLQVVRVAVDVENRTLRDVVSEIVGFAENKSGPWKVKWRLRPENKHILEARVNLTAETTFEGFMNHLVDRVNNMTGVQLGVSVFDMSRIIVISDTH